MVAFKSEDRCAPHRELESLGWKRVDNPQGHYEQMRDQRPVTSVGYLMPLIVHAGVPDDIVYQLTKLLCEHVDETRRVHRAWSSFEPATAWKNTGAELHPGAARYFEESGLMQ